jgi:hypothetical protein
MERKVDESWFKRDQPRHRISSKAKLRGVYPKRFSVVGIYLTNIHDNPTPFVLQKYLIADKQTGEMKPLAHNSGFKRLTVEAKNKEHGLKGVFKVHTIWYNLIKSGQKTLEMTSGRPTVYGDDNRLRPLQPGDLIGFSLGTCTYGKKKCGCERKTKVKGVQTVSVLATVEKVVKHGFETGRIPTSPKQKKKTKAPKRQRQPKPKPKPRQRQPKPRPKPRPKKRRVFDLVTDSDSSDDDEPLLPPLRKKRKSESPPPPPPSPPPPPPPRKKRKRISSLTPAAWYTREVNRLRKLAQGQGGD